MSNYKPFAIRDDGLKKYLDRTANIHNGFNYDQFVTMVKAKVNTTGLMKAFGVARATMDKWLKIYKEEEGVK